MKSFLFFAAPLDHLHQFPYLNYWYMVDTLCSRFLVAILPRPFSSAKIIQTIKCFINLRIFFLFSFIIINKSSLFLILRNYNIKLDTWTPKSWWLYSNSVSFWIVVSLFIVVGLTSWSDIASLFLANLPRTRILLSAKVFRHAYCIKSRWVILNLIIFIL